MRGFGEIAERLRRVTAQVFAGNRGMGSGVVWSSDGHVLTNAHVARSADAQVELWDGSRYEATVAARDPRRDLAILRLKAQRLESAQPGDSGALRPGEVVLAVGSPLGFAGALSTGVVHSVGPITGMGSQRWIRANVRLAPGNSGGPLANAQGMIVGINTAILNGLGIAAPISSALDLLRRGPRPALGVTLRPHPAGMLILGVEPGSPADASSLRAGDLVLGTWSELDKALDSGKEVIRVRFRRGDQRQVREAHVRLGVHQEAA
jgi:serine protease Do